MAEVFFYKSFCTGPCMVKGIESMELNKGYKVRLYPQGRQIEVLDFYADLTVRISNLIFRFLYGILKTIKRKATQKETCDVIRRMLKMKQFSKLSKVQESLLFLLALRAYHLYFSHITKNNIRPILMDRNQNCITIPVPLGKGKSEKIHLDFQRKEFYLPLKGIRNIQAKGVRDYKGDIQQAFIKVQRWNRYYLSFSYSEQVDDMKSPFGTGTPIGIDAGIKDLLIYSDGTKIVNPKFSKAREFDVSRYQRALEKKKKGSRKYYIYKDRIAKKFNRLVCKKTDFIHKLTYDLVRKHNIICVESLTLNALRKAKKKTQAFETNCRKAFDDADLNLFFRQLEYKCRFYHRILVKVPTSFPSSQLCSHCGYQNKELKNPDIRSWVCPNCHTVHDRDINAANNILNKGLEMLRNNRNIPP